MPYDLNITPRHTLILSLDAENYVVRFAATAIAQLQEELGRPMSAFSDWLQISIDEMPVVLGAGLEQSNGGSAEDVAASICASLEVEAFDRLVETLAVAVFPRAVERYYNVLASLQRSPEVSPTAEVALA